MPSWSLRDAHLPTLSSIFVPPVGADGDPSEAFRLVSSLPAGNLSRSIGVCTDLRELGPVYVCGRLKQPYGCTASSVGQFIAIRRCLLRSISNEQSRCVRSLYPIRFGIHHLHDAHNG
ncbi:uncharacterized protein LAESUDRAFT_305617 [Laetiporus sulphureus 93-53]|uniref:Uncharacterized protein n=1 Tax=Laetiporus sulphureus 93-53 TaxID=1314785 RepID=A0A165D8P3_9APHY|nr:uncharacterized protein LAESUDRAFT_305617 [Laetiporus sulphureus 93-53]KZT04343.1 hypothetical protein LAESUDRAFT_305617 [Laetiporus sulphureus 93-53]